MVKTYQLSKLGEFGSSLKVAPVTTEVVQNLDSCLQVNGSNEHRIEPQSILPDLTGFKVWQHGTRRFVIASKGVLFLLSEFEYHIIFIVNKGSLLVEMIPVGSQLWILYEVWQIIGFIL
jgi:hypothetical protein